MTHDIKRSSELDTNGNPYLLCPECGDELSAAYDVSHYGRLTINDSGVIAAVEMSDNYDNEPDHCRVFCDSCGFPTDSDDLSYFDEISWD